MAKNSPSMPHRASPVINSTLSATPFLSAFSLASAIAAGERSSATALVFTVFFSVDMAIQPLPVQMSASLAPSGICFTA